MKKSIIFSSLCAIVLSGCNYLEMDPEQMNSLEKVFTNMDDTKKWYNHTFSTPYLPTELSDSHYYNNLIFGMDDAACLQSGQLNAILLGQVNPARPVSGFNKYWFSIFYKGIRHCNLFLENVDLNMKLSDTDKTRMKAEVRFMRAMMHFWIIRKYGPIPIISKSIDTDNVGFMQGRNSMDECVKWICDEIDDLYLDLKTKDQDASNRDNWGFPTQGAALALKSRILLLAASPMYNGNTVYSEWKNDDGKQLVNQTYDADKWKAAADAAMVLIDLNWYKLLESEKGLAATFDDYVLNHRKVSTTWNDEIIWGRSTGQFWWNMSSWPAALYSWNARNSSTLELINSYFMADGLPAKPMEEWFAPREFSAADGNGTQQGTFMMFVEREPRFYADNFFPNQIIDYSSPSNPNTKTVVEYWFSGNSGGSKTPGDKNSTGFSPQKHISTDSWSDKIEGKANNPNVPYPIFRLAEIYLNYCEAANEYYGESGHNDVLKYLNKIKARTGVPPYTGSYSKSEMRNMIRQERRVELAWEGHRFFDVRRWFIAHGTDGVLNKPVHGLDMTKGTHSMDTEFYTMREVQPRYFRIEHYILPINATEVAFNSELLQAPFY